MILPVPNLHVLVHSDLTFGGRCGLKIFKMTTMAILNISVALMPPINFRLNLTNSLQKDGYLKIFKMAAITAILDIGMELFLQI